MCMYTGTMEHDYFEYIYICFPNLTSEIAREPCLSFLSGIMGHVETPKVMNHMMLIGIPALLVLSTGSQFGIIFPSLFLSSTGKFAKFHNKNLIIIDSLLEMVSEGRNVLWGFRSV